MLKFAKNGILVLGLLILTASAASAKDVAVGVHVDNNRYQPAAERRWVEGHYVTRTETVLIEKGYVERRWVPAVYRARYVGRHSETYVVQAGYYTTVEVPARYSTREVRTWVPGYYEDVPVVVRERRSKPTIDFSMFLDL